MVSMLGFSLIFAIFALAKHGTMYTKSFQDEIMGDPWIMHVLVTEQVQEHQR